MEYVRIDDQEYLFDIMNPINYDGRNVGSKGTPINRPVYK